MSSLIFVRFIFGVRILQGEKRTKQDRSLLSYHSSCLNEDVNGSREFVQGQMELVLGQVELV
tara:strand:- start:5551 stop:5736 length:186 start_codon:yes stop_codon:yes gene_type:complete